MRYKHFFHTLLPVLCFFLIFTSASAQKKYTLSGYITDKQSGEDLIGASVVAVGTGTGGTTNGYGYFAVTLPAGTYTIKISYLGYKKIEQKIILKADVKMNFKLDQDNVMNEVDVSAENPRDQLDKTQMSKIDLNVEQMKKLPVLFGEVDVLKTLQLL